MTSLQLPYFYESELSPDHLQFTLSEASSRHCVQVLRMQSAEQLQITNGKGLLATARITIAHKKHCQVEIIHTKVEQPSSNQVTIAVAPTKNINRIEWALEKLTEVGVHKIVLMETQRTERSVVKLDRLNQILISAMLQSRQLYLPSLSGLVKLSALLEQAKDYTHKWIAHCLDEGSKDQLAKALDDQRHIVLIGPEGDFTPEEIQTALTDGYQPTTLGQNRLRTETAAVVAGVLLTI